LWNAADGSSVRDLVRPSGEPAHPGPVYGLRFTADSRRLVSTGTAPNRHGFLAVWFVPDGKLFSAQTLATGPVFGLAVSPDGRRLALACGPRGRGGPALGYVLATPAQP
jgi:WD40 repeat protein